MKQPKVSAVITTHNRLGLLKRAINSVKAQTYNNIECIVVSDNSNDGTDEYCSSLEEITYISISADESKGGNYARNLGIKNASGVYVAFLDDDDYWKPTKIEKQVALAEEKRCGVVYCGRTLEYVEGASVNYQESVTLSEYTGDVSKIILTRIFATTSEIMIRKDLLCQVGMFDETLKYWQEYELSIRLAQLSEFQCYRENLIVYRIDINDKGRLTNKYTGWRDTVKYIRQKHRHLYANLNYKEKLCHIQFVWQEAIARCNSAGFKFKARYYGFILWLSCVPIRIKKSIL